MLSELEAVPNSCEYLQDMDNEELIEEEEVENNITTPLQPHTLLLKDGETVATMYPIPANAELFPLGLLAFLLDEFNMEVEKGDSFPFYETLTLEQFKDIWFHEDGHICVMVLGEIPELDYSETNNDGSDEVDDNYGTDVKNMRHTVQYKKRKERRDINLSMQWEKQCLGIFSLQPAYPGRSSHVVTGSFLVNAGIRGKGIGKTLMETFVEWSKRLGFTSCFFPLVYSTNVGIRRILEVLNFRRIGKLPESGILKGFNVPVDSFMYGKEFTHISKNIDSLVDPQKNDEIAKYKRLIHYLETGKYPEHIHRKEKARLRVSARSHYLLNGKLMTKGREIILDPELQEQIAIDIHLVEHQGINRVTSRIVERYHWKGIKNTVSKIIGKCPKCKVRQQDGTGVIVVPNAQTTSTLNVNEMDHTATLSQMAAAVVRTLQTEPTPPDFMESNKRSSVPQLSPDFELNTFNKFVQEDRERTKRKYLEVAQEGYSQKLISQQTEKTSEQLLNDAIMSLDDKVLAAMNDQRTQKKP